MKREHFTGTGKLVRLIVRRDWKLLLAWALLIIMILALVAVSIAQLYTTPEMIRQFVDETNNSPAEVALVGKILSPTLGAIIAWKESMSIFIIGGVVSLLAVIKYTRTEEDTGRSEMISSSAVGKYSGLTAALIVAFGVNILIAAASIVTLMGFGLPVDGSVAFALSMAGVGCFFAAIGSIAAQVARSTGPARGIAGGILALAFLVRVAADGTGASWLSWLTPSGWMVQVQPFADLNWWVLLLFAGAVVVLAAMAFALSSRRDLGTGLMPQRSGPAMASPGLHSPLALAWRLQRGMLLAYVIGCIIAGMVIGYIIKTVAEQIETNPQFMEMLSRLAGNATPADGFLTIFLVMLGFVGTVYAVMAALKMQSEEKEMHADAILATPVGRLQWAAGHLAIAIGGTAVLLMAFGLSAGLTYGLAMGNVGNEMTRMFLASVAYLPAILVILGIAVALFGLLPRLTIVSWGALAVCLLIELIGEMKIANMSMLGISPFNHVPMMLSGDNSILPLAGLVIVAAVLIAAGLIGFRHRDIS